MTNTNTTSGAADDSLLLCASDLQHSAIYDNHVEMQACIRAVANRIAALASAAAPPQQGVQWQCGPQASGFTTPQADSQPAPIDPAIAADLERSDWTPEEALRWYAAGKHYDTVPNGDGSSSARILDNGAVASNALKSLSREYAEHKGDVALSAPQADSAPSAAAAAPAEQPEPRTGHAEADRLIGRLMSSDPDFDDCLQAASLIQREIKGPDGYATWREAATVERFARIKAESAFRASRRQAPAVWLDRYHLPLTPTAPTAPSVLEDAAGVQAMTRDDVIRMAREAGCVSAEFWPKDFAGLMGVFERFAALVAAKAAAAEREACACFALINGKDAPTQEERDMAWAIAAAIRARSKHVT